MTYMNEHYWKILVQGIGKDLDFIYCTTCGETRILEHKKVLRILREQKKTQRGN